MKGGCQSATGVWCVEKASTVQRRHASARLGWRRRHNGKPPRAARLRFFLPKAVTVPCRKAMPRQNSMLPAANQRQVPEPKASEIVEAQGIPDIFQWHGGSNGEIRSTSERKRRYASSVRPACRCVYSWLKPQCGEGQGVTAAHHWETCFLQKHLPPSSFL